MSESERKSINAGQSSNVSLPFMMSSSDTTITTTTTTTTTSNTINCISQFYAGRSIFITGGTGFMGKVLVEKLLRSCPDIKNIYILIRPKRGQDIQTRLSELLNSPLFDTIRNKNPQNLTKVLPIEGDITLEQLGISDSDQGILCKNVSIVFHSAATVKFDEKLKLSVKINMLGTKRIIELCHKMTLLDALVHVSTAYCNCDRSEVSEEIYSPPYNPYDIISLIDWLPEDLLDELTPSLIGKRPNTYTFTKALAEHMLLKNANNLPVAIVRPSIVIASLNEPFPGWVDNWNGPTGLVSALGQGLFRTILCEKNFIADMVPVDIVINLMIAAAWRTANEKSSQDGLVIYNCCTGQQNPITWGNFVDYALNETIKHPLDSCLWYPTGVLRLNRTINSIYGFLVHYIPAYILDILSRLTGRKPIMVKVQNKIAKAVQCLEYFTLHQWKFKDDNVQLLSNLLNSKDREIFQFDVKKIKWDKYVECYVLGFREFLFKQTPDTLPSSRRRLMRLYIIHQISKLIMLLLTWRFVLAHSKKARELWSRFMFGLLYLIQSLPLF